MLKIREKYALVHIDKNLANQRPELVNEWNYEKNGLLQPEMFTCKSNEKVWWKCSKGHEWETIIANRTKGHGCPICSKTAKRKVECIETGRIYVSLADADRDTGVAKANIWKACNGKYNTAGGFHWRYLSEDSN